MTTTSRWRLARLGAGALLALAAAGLLAPATARAACGNHAVARSAAVGSLDDLDAWLRAGEADAMGRDAGPSGKPSPCSGLLCSRGPMVPLLPPPSIVAHGEQWVCLGDPPPCPDLDPLALLADEPAARPSHLGPDVERPPRARPPSLRPIDPN